MNAMRRVIDLWFKPVRAERLAPFRIAIATIIFLDTALSLVPDAMDWFGVEGAFSPSQYEAWRGEWMRWSVLPLDASDGLIYTLLLLLMLFAAMTALGLLTRVASIGMWVLLVSFHTRNPHILNAGDTLLRIAAFYIMLMPAGVAWSIDNLIRARIGWRVDGWVLPWSLRLAQLQIMIVYFATGLEKLRGFEPIFGGYDGLPGTGLGDWLSGEAVHKAISHATLGRMGWLVADWPWWIFAPLTWATLLFEILFIVLIIWRRTRWYALAFGFALHFGIFLTMEVTHFSWTTVSYYLLFVPAAVLMDMAGKQTGSDVKRRYLVFYDEMCPICKKSKRTLERLDWLKRLTFADIHDRRFAEAELLDVSYADMLREMYVKRPDGSYFGGFKAFRAMVPILPLCWPLIPFLWLPGVAWVGSRVYAFIARNRFKFAKCDDEFCSLHLRLLAGKELDEEVIRQIVELHKKRQSLRPEEGKPT